MPLSKEEYKKYYREYYQKNKEKLQEKTKKWREKNKPLYHLAQIRSRCKKEGLPFDLTIEDIAFPELCPVLGIKLEYGEKHVRDHSPSVDRIDPSKGYTKDNIQVVSHLANKMKSSATTDQLVAFSKWVLERYE